MFSLSEINLAMLIIASALTLIWILFFFMGQKYNSMFEPLNEKEYPLKEIYGFGYGILEMIHYKYKSKGDRLLRTELEILYGGKYVEYYLRVIHSQQLTMAITLFVLAFYFYPLAGVAPFVVFLMFAGLAYYYFGNLPKEKLEKRSQEMLHDFSDVVSKLALLTNAGMVLGEAWAEVAYAGETTIYKEMQNAVIEMNNGVAEVDAIYNFGSRCILSEIKKFTSTIIQGITKGNRELSEMLQAQSKEVWELKKQLVRREGEKAASKLLIPIFIMFAGVLIMIIVPLFANLG